MIELHVGMEKSVESRGKCDLHVGMGKSELNMYKFFDYMCKWQHGDYTCRKILLITCRNGESGITHV